MAIGQLTGPIASGLVAQQVGFEKSCSYLGIAILLFGLLYIPVLFQSFPKPILDEIIRDNYSLLVSNS